MLTLDEAQELLSKYIGTAGPISTTTIEAGAIRRFVEAIGDPNPLYVDREYALGTRWKGIVAPPTFLCTISAPLELQEVDYGTMGLNGGNVFELFRPVRLGDVVKDRTEFHLGVQAARLEVFGQLWNASREAGPLWRRYRSFRRLAISDYTRTCVRNASEKVPGDEPSPDVLPPKRRGTSSVAKPWHKGDRTPRRCHGRGVLTGPSSGRGTSAPDSSHPGSLLKHNDRPCHRTIGDCGVAFVDFVQ